MPEKTQRAELDAIGKDGQRELVDAFMTAWERADVAALVELLALDARFTMPPLPAWFHGRDDIGSFFAERMFARPWRLVELRANGQPAFAGYRGDPSDRYRLIGINVLSIRAGRVAWIASFLDPDVPPFQPAHGHAPRRSCPRPMSYGDERVSHRSIAAQQPRFQKVKGDDDAQHRCGRVDDLDGVVRGTGPPGRGQRRRLRARRMAPSVFR